MNNRQKTYDYYYRHAIEFGHSREKAHEIAIYQAQFALDFSPTQKDLL